MFMKESDKLLDKESSMFMLSISLKDVMYLVFGDLNQFGGSIFMISVLS